MLISHKIAIALLLGVVILPGCVSGGTGRVDTTQPKPVISGDHNITIRVGDLDAFLYGELPQHRTMAAHFVFALTPHREVGV